MLDGSNNIIAPNIIPVGHISEAELKKSASRRVSSAAKLRSGRPPGTEQTRSDVTSPDGPSSAEVTSTETRGLETELKWVPNCWRRAVSSCATWMKAEYVVDAAATMVSTRVGTDSWTR